MKFFLTLDIGTTSVKTCLFDREFNLLALSNEEYELDVSEKDKVEMNPDKYWQSSCNGIKRVLEISGANPMQIMAITVVTQGETLILVDEKGNVLRNAIVWLDGRAEDEAQEINSHFSFDKFYLVTGLSELTGTCPAAKIMWIKKNEPEVFARTAKFLMLEDYIIMKLTGKFVTDKSIMTSTGYFDINQESLWHEMLVLIEVRSDQFPNILDSGVKVGGVLFDTAEDIGLIPGTIVSTGAMDQTASAIGAGNVVEGIITETTGSALAIAATVKDLNFANPIRLTIYKHAVPGKYLILPYCSTAGILLKWFKNQFCLYEIDDCAKSKCNIYPNGSKSAG